VTGQFPRREKSTVPYNLTLDSKTSFLRPGAAIPSFLSRDFCRPRPPFFSDVTIWTAQTVGSVNVMSTYPGQEIIMRWNFEIIPVCMPSFRTANGRNMHTVKNNPGFDGILMYMGYSFSFEHKRSGGS
jgi:hypothetical protein